MNLYQKFAMRPPQPNSIAGRMLSPGQDRRVSGVAPPVPLSKAPSDFFRKANFARASVMAGPAPWALGSGYTGHGVSGFNANMAQSGLGGFMGGPFAGLGNAGNNIFGEFNFGEAWSSADFLGQNPNWLSEVAKQVGLDPNLGPVSSPYDPEDSSRLSQASAKWAELKALRGTSTKIDAFMTEIQVKMRAAINEADSGTRANVIAFTNRRWKSIEERRISAFDTIKGLVSRVLSFTPPAPEVAPGGAGEGGFTMGTGGGRPPTSWETIAAINRQRAAEEAAKKAAADAAADAAKNAGSGTAEAKSGPSFGLIAGVGAGVILLGAVAYFALKK
jgi:hypothetical protein